MVYLTQSILSNIKVGSPSGRGKQRNKECRQLPGPTVSSTHIADIVVEVVRAKRNITETIAVQHEAFGALTLSCTTWPGACVCVCVCGGGGIQESSWGFTLHMHTEQYKIKALCHHKSNARTHTHIHLRCRYNKGYHVLIYTTKKVQHKQNTVSLPICLLQLRPEATHSVTWNTHLGNIVQAGLKGSEWDQPDSHCYCCTWLGSVCEHEGSCACACGGVDYG